MHLQHDVIWTCTTSLSVARIRVDASIFAVRGVYYEKLASGWACHFLVTSYVPGMHVIASARASSVVRAYLRKICCTHAVSHQKDQTKCPLVDHRFMGACDAFGLPRVRVSRFLRTRRWRVFVNSRNIELILIFNRVHKTLRLHGLLLL